MSHRWRVTLAMSAVLALTVLGAWAVMFRAVVVPVVRGWAEERVDVVLQLVELAEAAPATRRLAVRAAKDLGVEIEVIHELPADLESWTLVERDGRRFYHRHRRGTPMIVEIRGADSRWLSVRFGADIEGVPRRVLGGLVFVGIAGLGVVTVGTRWVLRPLETTEQAMRRIGAGDLGHRVPEGRDVAGRIGHGFNEMAARVEGMVRGQRDLLAAVSHELRTPLTRIRLAVELLREQSADPKRLASIEADVDEIDVLVATLLESARLERGGWALERAPASVRAVVDDAAAAVALGGRTLVVEVPDIEIEADAARLSRALRNLLHNFAKYTPEGSTCWIRARRDDGLTIVVEDDGPGVVASALPKLFEPFYRAESSRNRKTGGLGLGLLLVRQIVEAHGGTIRAEAREGGGLRFVVTLP
jgi:signal transduction histidine kinase